VKLVVPELESAALRRFLEREPTRVSCAIATVEVLRAVRPQGATSLTRARRVLQRLHLVSLDDALLEAAAMLEPAVMRSLDAIHLAAAQSFGDDVTAIVTYDARMAAGARLLDIQVAAPR
jgi:predicted nucleic acid-binding protein